MTTTAYDFHRRRTRQHQLFALGTTCALVRRTHVQLARAYGAAASYVQSRSHENR